MRISNGYWAGLALFTVAAVLWLLLADDNMNETPAWPPGTIMVQLGAYDSLAELETAWAELETKEHGSLRNHPRTVIRVVTDERRYYRLRLTGFPDRNIARNFCADLLQTYNQPCLPVVMK